MRPSERVDHLTELRDRIVELVPGHSTACSNLHAFSGELPSSNGGGGKGGHSDRTAMVAARTDPFIRDLALFDDALEDARKAIRTAHRIMLTATAFEKQEDQIEWCRSCARMLDHKGEPTHSPVSSNHLCRFCADFRRQYSRLPDVRILEYRARYGRVTEQVVKRYTEGAKA